MRNNEYRERLVDGIKNIKSWVDSDMLNKEVKSQAEFLLSTYNRLLAEYDRLHPELSGVSRLVVETKSGYGFRCKIHDSVNGCNITVIDGTLNVEIK